jgi:predicted transcriptional regulator
MKKRVNISLDDEIHLMLKSMAKMRHTTVSQLITDLVRQNISYHEYIECKFKERMKDAK